MKIGKDDAMKYVKNILNMTGVKNFITNMNLKTKRNLSNVIGSLKYPDWRDKQGKFPNKHSTFFYS